MRVLVTGATGLLGGSLVPFLRGKGLEVIAHGMKKPADVQADLCDLQVTCAMLDTVAPDAIIHLVCLSDVDACEEDPNLAYLLNVHCLENVVGWLRDHSRTRLVHISTDQVYDGADENREEDVTLRNSYALTKYASELVARQVDSVVLRTNFFGRSRTQGKSTFSDWLINSLQQQAGITLFSDVMWSPLSLENLSQIVLVALRSKVTGVFNAGSHGGMSKRDFAHAVARRLKLPLETARDGVLADVALRAPRPRDMRMDSTLFEKTFGVSLPALADEIATAELE